MHAKEIESHSACRANNELSPVNEFIVTKPNKESNVADTTSNQSMFRENTPVFSYCMVSFCMTCKIYAHASQMDLPNFARMRETGHRERSIRDSRVSINLNTARKDLQAHALVSHLGIPHFFESAPFEWPQRLYWVLTAPSGDGLR